jgi:ankyrin repeat protein
MTLLPRRVHTRNLREIFAKRTKQYPNEKSLDSYFNEPPLKVLNSKNEPKEIDLARIDKLLSITGGANELRRHADLEARKNDIDTKRDISSMALCCKNGDIVKAKELLDDINIEINDTTEDGKTFLYIASENGHLNIVQMLLNTEGCDPNLGMQNTGITPLMASIIGSNTIEDNQLIKNPDETAAVILALCNAGADINLKAKRTLLRPRNMMTDKQREKIVGKGINILKDKSELIETEEKGGELSKDRPSLTLVPRGSTALHIAVACACLPNTRYFCHPQLVMVLVACGADSTIVNINEQTPKQLISESTTVDAKLGRALLGTLHAADSNGINESLLRSADTLRAGVRTGQLSQVKRVINSMANDRVGLMFLVHAVGGLQKMNLLLEKSKSVKYRKDKREEVIYDKTILKEWESDCASPLAIAARLGYQEVVIALVNAGASINVGLPGPISPMMQSLSGAGIKKGGTGAGWEACRETSTWLFENGADVLNRSCDTGVTALHSCAKSGLAVLYNTLKSSIPKEFNLTGTTPDWNGNIPENLLAIALNKHLPIKIPNEDGEPLVAKGEHLDDFVEDVVKEDEDPAPSELTVIIGDVREAEEMGTLHIPLDETVKDVDQLVGTRMLVLAHQENNVKLAGLVSF